MLSCGCSFYVVFRLRIASTTEGSYCPASSLVPSWEAIEKIASSAVSSGACPGCSGGRIRPCGRLETRLAAACPKAHYSRRSPHLARRPQALTDRRFGRSLFAESAVGFSPISGARWHLLLSAAHGGKVLGTGVGSTQSVGFDAVAFERQARERLRVVRSFHRPNVAPGG